MRIFILLACLCVGIVHAAEPDPARIDRIFAAWDKPDSPGLAVAVVRDGRIVFSRGYGAASLEYGVPNKPSTVFHIASLSKQFTAFCVHLLAAEGKLTLDDDVRKHVPEMQIPGITLRHLLHHTSGLRDQWELLTLAGLRLDDTVTEGDITGVLWGQKELNFAPGEQEMYSNSGYMLLGLVVKRVSGKSLAEFAKERIFDPLGMANTHFQESYGRVVKDRAYSYARTRDGWRYVALSFSNTGATSLFTTVEDLARWDANFEQARVGAAVLPALLTQGRLNNGRPTDYASGLFVGSYRGLPVVGHGGADAGYRSNHLRLPQQRLSILLLGNAADLDTSRLARQVADLYLEGTPGLQPQRQPPTEIDVDTREVAAFLGDYEMRPGFVLNFRMDAGKFVVQAPGQPAFPLFAAADGSYFTKAFESSVTFIKQPGEASATTGVWKQGGRDQALKRIVRQLPSADALRACTGQFYSEELRTLYSVSLRDDKLFVRYPRGETELKPVHAEHFTGNWPLLGVVLKRDAKGACESLLVSTGRAKDLKFARVKIVPEH